MTTPCRWVLGLLLAGHFLLLGWILRFPQRSPLPGVAASFQGADLAAVRRAGERLLRGEALYPPAASAVSYAPESLPFRYLPPAAALPGTALASLPPAVARWAWLLAVELLLLSTVAALVRRCGSAWPAAFCAGLWLLSPPVYVDLWLGQFSLAAALLLLRAGLELRLDGIPRSEPDHRERRRGLWAWGLAAGLKVVPLFCAPALWREPRFRPGVRRVAGALGAATLLYFALFPTELASFLRLNAEPSAIWRSPANESLQHLLLSLDSLGLSERTARWLGPLLGGILLGAAAWITRGSGPAEIVWLLGLWTCAFLLALREVWLHHSCFLLPFASLLELRFAAAAQEGCSAEALRLRRFGAPALCLVVWSLLPRPVPDEALRMAGLDSLLWWRPAATLLLFGLCAAACASARPVSAGGLPRRPAAGSAPAP